MTTQTMTKCNISHCTREVAGIAYNGNPYCNVCMPSDPALFTTPRYKTAEGCERCTTDLYVPHYNCTCGANRAHCTSDYCY